MKPAVGGSLCDRCYSPGACCKSFTLHALDGELLTNWLGDDPRSAVSVSLPFVPAELVGEWPVPEGQERAGEFYQAWRWSCPVLQDDGRCGAYETRPEVCRSFEPAGDKLCVHFNATEGGPH